MKLIKVLSTAIIAGLGLTITSVAQAACSGTAAIGTGNGCYEATHPTYVILGTTGNLADAAKTIEYTYDNTQGLGAADVTANNISSADNTFLSGDSTAILFVQNGNLGIRANAPFTLTITVPVIASTSGCTPAFLAGSQTNGSLGVSANFSMSVTDDSSTEVASYAVQDGGITDSTASATTLACPSSAGTGDGVFTVTLSPNVTTEYTLRFDIGFETDGARDNALAQVGADGEPAADTYEMTLGLSASAS